MKALSLTQPWATLIAIGAKLVETRSWYTGYRGELFIHAAKGFPKWAKDECYSSVFASSLWPKTYGCDIGLEIKELPLGAIIAKAELVGCISTNYPASFDGNTGRRFEAPRYGTPECTFGDYSPNRFMWFLENVHALPEPIPCRGALGIWTLPVEAEQAALDQRCKAESPLYCRPCQLDDHSGHLDGVCIHENSFNSDCRCEHG